jgi:pimeloyl-ACP methyl ester carboxylesterase
VKRLYTRYIHDWETRLTTRDNNRVVRPFEFGLEWAQQWPQTLGMSNDDLPSAGDDEAEQESFLAKLNAEIIADSDRFFGYDKPTDFRVTNRVVPGERERTQFLEFTSAVDSPHPVNNQVRCRLYPAERHSKKAVVLLPHWNSKPHSYVVLCKVLAKLGISTLRLSLPYHDSRLPSETERSDYAVSSNIGRTIDATRQAIIDTRSCFDWLEQQGYEKFGVVGTSLGSCYAFLASAHDKRIRVNVFNHASTDFADVVWTGQSTRHVKAGIEPVMDLERLRKIWAAISPRHYYDKFRDMDKRMLVIYADYDLTFLPEYSRQVVAGLKESGIDYLVKVLPCGHYTTGETPFKFLDGWHIGKFLKTSL